MFLEAMASKLKSDRFTCRKVSVGVLFLILLYFRFWIFTKCDNVIASSIHFYLNTYGSINIYIYIYTLPIHH